MKEESPYTRYIDLALYQIHFTTGWVLKTSLGRSRPHGDLKTSVGDSRPSRSSRLQDAPKTPRKPQWETAQDFKRAPATPRRPQREPAQDARPQDSQDARKTSLGDFKTLTSRQYTQDVRRPQWGTAQDFKTQDSKTSRRGSDAPKTSGVLKTQDLKTGHPRCPKTSVGYYSRIQDLSGTLLKTQIFKTGAEDARKTSVTGRLFKTEDLKTSSFKTGPRRRPEDLSGRLLKAQDLETSKLQVRAPKMPSDVALRLRRCGSVGTERKTAKDVYAEIIAGHGEVDNGKRVEACRIISRRRVRALTPSSCSLAVGPGLKTRPFGFPPLGRVELKAL
ncbi:hypothetical protein C8R44DRAFT_743659 [Mycena epipterygia]|nr:hypothetical protein C8R44DRAFT_743659 [Mycena epipterygia]